MISYQYTYLIGNIFALAIWLFFFFRRKDTRKEMLIISIIFGIMGLLVESVYIYDWWQPLTITGTAIGLEDFLFGFLFGGVAAVFYEHLFNKKIKSKKVKKLGETRRNIQFSFLIILMILIFFISFFIFNLNSFISTIFAFIIPIAIIYFKRKDLIKDSIISGILTLITAIIIYQILNFITPGFFNEFWFYQNIGQITIFKIPLEEIIWFILAGAFIGPLYEYWKEGKLIKNK